VLGGVLRTRAQSKPRDLENDRGYRWLLALAVAFFVFFAAATGARVVAADFGSGADWFGRFGLGCAGLILQVLLLALLFAIELARYIGQALRRGFVGARGCTGHRGGCTTGT
jgi:hypothetical protein